MSHIEWCPFSPYMNVVLSLAVFPTEAGIIVLVDDTPEVRLEGGTGTVRIQFTLSPDITNALCTLRDVAPQQDCEFWFYLQHST